MARPYFNIHVSHHLAITAHLTPYEQGALISLLINYWERQSPLNNQDERLRKVLGVTPKKWRELKPMMAEFFSVEGDIWTHLDLEEQMKQGKRNRFRNPLKTTNNGTRPPIAEWREIRERIFARDDYTCTYCGDRGGKLECDHIYPVAKGGTHEDSNLTTACFKCNRSKRSKTLEEWIR